MIKPMQSHGVLLRILMKSLLQAEDLYHGEDIEEEVDQLELFYNEMWNWNNHPTMSVLLQWMDGSAQRILRNAAAIDNEWHNRQLELDEEYERTDADEEYTQLIVECFDSYTQR